MGLSFTLRTEGPALLTSAFFEISNLNWLRSFPRELSAVGAAEDSPGRKAWVTNARQRVPFAQPHPRKASVLAG
jgi:hypothetical protein